MPGIVITGRGASTGAIPIGALCALLIWQEGGFAAEPVAAARYRVEQPSQPLSDSLIAIARQTGASVLFDPSAVQGRMSRPVSGKLSAAEAITHALEGTGLVLDVTRDGAIVVRPMAAPTLLPDGPVRGVQASAVRTGLVQSPSAVTQAPFSTTSPGLAAAAAGQPAVESGAGATPSERVEVTGSRLKRVESAGPVPVNTYTRDDIDRSGQPTLERFLSSLNEASVSPGEGAYSPLTGQGSVQLRGLPLGSTLVLINGRRVQAVGSSSANFFNLNLIPMAAVERVEIVPVGSSAVYGGDALAGVVNIILKKSIDGVALDTRLATGKGVGDGSFSLAMGDSGDRGSYLLLGSYGKSTPLNMSERAFFRDADYRRFGGVDARSRFCTPGTVRSVDGSNLPGLNASFAGIPGNPSGDPLSGDSFASTAGEANLCSDRAGGNGSALIHGMETIGLHAMGDWTITEGWSLFSELTHADDRLNATETGLILNDVLVPATSPNNPFGVPVKVSAMLGPENGAQAFSRHTRFTRALAGVRGELGGGWDVEATLSTSRDSGSRQIANLNGDRAALNAALASTDPSSSLNPFTAGRAATDDVLRSIWSDGERVSRGGRDQLGAYARGAVFQAPAGPVEAIIGTELSRDKFDAAIPGQPPVQNSRRSSAIYTELRVPLLRAEVSVGSPWDLATLTVAGRRDSYSDFGAANTYQAGFEARPSRTLLFRASTATSFKPPTMLQTSLDEVSFPSELLRLSDPARGGEPVLGAEVVRASNPALAPERGRAFAFGALWEPDALAGSRFGLTVWRVRIDGLIALLSPQVTLANEALFPGFVTRGPSENGQPGPVTRVLYAEVNYGQVQTGGADIEASHSWQSDVGRWTLGGSATRTTEYRVAMSPSAPAEDRLGRRSVDFWAPKWKGRLSTGLSRGSWTLSLTSRYTGRYKDVAPSERDLGGFWTHDIAGTVDLKQLGMSLGPLVKSASLSLGIANLSNREPQYVETSPYYDVTQGDWRGRYASARLSLAW